MTLLYILEGRPLGGGLPLSLGRPAGARLRDRSAAGKIVARKDGRNDLAPAERA